MALFSEEISSLQHIISPQQEDGDARTPVDTEGTPKQVHLEEVYFNISLQLSHAPTLSVKEQSDFILSRF